MEHMENKERAMPSQTLARLRRTIAAMQTGGASQKSAQPTFGFGLPALDSWLGGGLAGGVLHEIYAKRQSDAVAAAGFGLGLAMRAADERPLVWARQDLVDVETGRLYGDGIAAFGLDPGRLIVVRARDPTAALRAAGEAVRCCALGAALVEIWGEPRTLDLTASRRLALSAAASGVTLVMIRFQAEPAPSSAATRWCVAAAASTPLEANAPGRPAFEAALLRHRAGLGPRTWRLEWDRDSLSFAPPALPRPVVPVPAGRPAAGGESTPWRRAG